MRSRSSDASIAATGVTEPARAVARTATLAVSLVVAASVLGALSRAQVGDTIRVSVGRGDVEGDGLSTFGSLSADGRFIAFASSSSNLVPGDTNGATDVFVRDLQLGTTELVSRASDGTIGNADSGQTFLSADGRYVVFESLASNFDPSDANPWNDVYVRDRASGVTTRVSRAWHAADVDGESTDPSISADGRRIAFESVATNLVPGDTNAAADVFVFDVVSGVTQRVSVATNGAQADAPCGDAWISADGSLVAYASVASNLVAGDTNHAFDVFARVLASGTTEIESVSSSGQQGSNECGEVACSSNGRYVVFWSFANDLVPGDTNIAGDVFLRDRVAGTLERASLGNLGVQGNSGSSNPFVSDDGRFIAFRSFATNFAVPDLNGVPDIFVRDRVLGLTQRVSVSSQGAEGTGFNQVFSISADGRRAAFHSFSENLVPFDTNGAADVFVRDILCAVPWCEIGAGCAGASGAPSLWATGAALPGASTEFHAQGAKASSAGAWIFGTSALALPIVAGVLWPLPELVLPCASSGAGAATLEVAWPIGVPSGLAVVAQAWFVDASAAQGFSATPGVRASFP